MHNVSNGNDLHEMSKSVPRKNKKIFQNVVYWNFYPVLSIKPNNFRSNIINGYAQIKTKLSIFVWKNNSVILYTVKIIHHENTPI